MKKYIFYQISPTLASYTFHNSFLNYKTKFDFHFNSRMARKMSPDNTIYKFWNHLLNNDLLSIIFFHFPSALVDFFFAIVNK